ncbi:gliding motility-associated C-terminal domain-containing protein, partial [Patescibacteria group bacterium]|nr:gliding motility-associated C-terminal domain-containing protein [Patescibacteria group bacterium]
TPTPSPSPSPAPTTGAWTPCDPTSGWKCGESSSGNSACNGQQIAWGSGNDGEVICPAGTIVSESMCQGKNDDSVQTKEIRVIIVPDSTSFSNSVSFRARSTLYCKFSCNKLFCGADGCGWAKCEPGNITNIDKIEFKVYNSFGSLVYSATINAKNSFSWNGTNNSGKKLNSGTYGYRATVYLTNGKSYISQDIIKIQ